MTEQEIKQRITAVLKTQPTPLNNIFYSVFQELWFDKVKNQPIPNYQDTDVFKQTMPQVFGIALDMWRNGELKATRFYDNRPMPFGEGAAPRKDRITDYDRNVWVNCWQFFCPVAYFDLVNIVFAA